MSHELHLFCACGGELIADGMTTEQRDSFLEIWAQHHVHSECHPVGQFQAHWKRWTDFFAELAEGDSRP